MAMWWMLVNAFRCPAAMSSVLLTLASRQIVVWYFDVNSEYLRIICVFSAEKSRVCVWLFVIYSTLSYHPDIEVCLIHEAVQTYKQRTKTKRQSRPRAFTSFLMCMNTTRHTVRSYNCHCSRCSFAFVQEIRIDRESLCWQIFQFSFNDPFASYEMGT